jgi:hypothetical protein
MPARPPNVQTPHMNPIAPHDCTLRLAVDGHAEPCPQELCAFWEPGGAVVAGACMIERLGVDARRPDLAVFLLETRERLEQVRPPCN